MNTTTNESNKKMSTKVFTWYAMDRFIRFIEGKENEVQGPAMVVMSEKSGKGSLMKLSAEPGKNLKSVKTRCRECIMFLRKQIQTRQGICWNVFTRTI